MSFDLTDEKAIDILIWWIESSDGSIDYREEEAVEVLLDEMDYSMDSYYKVARLKISGLSTDKIGQLVDEAISWGAKHFSAKRKKNVLNLLEQIAESNGITPEEKGKLKQVEQAFS